MIMEAVIGITANSTHIDNRGYPEPHKVNFSPQNISKAVSMAGENPIILPVNDPGIAKKDEKRRLTNVDLKRMLK